MKVQVYSGKRIFLRQILEMYTKKYAMPKVV